ncbi:hypothetical protein CYQ88_03385 [Hydrogenovibrio sp. SC-1]|uniref:hypothetical protein n=1 Tax=Hydrogenovibrio sp. SC-1 TaxID=2065820 RepID=UPI000C7B3D8C|nr:hypothetical protein [Hydrogenovibrio sp. SC-1]PLA74955.1 hypothetical protein CYQ88_03385 [Hydrogenovibrio sp. SC-1]
MVISSANAATSSYDVAGQNSKVAISTQNSKITQPQQADLVSLSSESVDAQRKEKYALKTDPVEFYKAWLDTEPRYIYLEGPKPYEDLLPETQTYIDQLNERLKNAKSPEQRQGIEAYISGASRYGDKEMIQSDSDLKTRLRVDEVSVSLMSAHLEINNEELAVPEGLQRAESSVNAGIRSLSDVAIQLNEKIGISREETLAELAIVKKQHRANLEAFFYGWLNGSRTMEDEMQTRTNAAQEFNKASGMPDNR